MPVTGSAQYAYNEAECTSAIQKRRATLSSLLGKQAARVGSSYIEPEHLLLAVMRFCEVELDEALKLKALEDSVRTELARTPHRNIISKNCVAS